MHKNDNVTHEMITAIRNLNAYLMQIEKAIVEKALKGDPLGKLAVSVEDLKQRDIMIFTEAKKRHIPIMMCLSGGYGVENYRAVGESLEAVIEIMVDSDKRPILDPFYKQ